MSFLGETGELNKMTVLNMKAITLSLVLLLLHVSAAAQQLEVYTESLPPFQIVAEEGISGSATQQVEHILTETALSYRIQVVPWARAYNIVKSSPNTLIYSINRTPEREPLFHWIKVVAEIGNSFISLTDNALSLHHLDDAKKHVVGVVRDGYAHELLVAEGFVQDNNLYVVASLEQQLFLLLSGKIDLLFTDIQSVKLALVQQKIDPELVSVRLTQQAWNRQLYLAANIDSEPQIIKKLNMAAAQQQP